MFYNNIFFSLTGAYIGNWIGFIYYNLKCFKYGYIFDNTFNMYDYGMFGAIIGALTGVTISNIYKKLNN